MTETISLSTLFLRALSSASQSYSLPTIDDGTQTLISSALTDLNTLVSRINALALFSSNETLEDINTRNIVYLLVPYVASELQGRLKTTNRSERLVSLRQVENHLRIFLARLEDYEIVPADDRELHSRSASAIADPAARRAVKIQQYKNEKELRNRIETLRKRRQQKPHLNISGTSDYALIASLLPSASSESKNADSEDDSDDESLDTVLRTTSLLVVRLFYAQAHAQLESIATEMQLLAQAPPEEPAAPTRGEKDKRDKRREEENDMWKLDQPRPDQGPLLDDDGKPLRPFTILPSGTSSAAQNRQRLAGQVFGPDHRLPSMTIDEYLQIEQERGNIITGGGPASEAIPTSSEQLALDAEQDGTAEGLAREEEKRQKDEHWAVYTDEHQKGAGNTMNRG